MGIKKFDRKIYALVTTKINALIRKWYLKYEIGKLGKIVEEEDKLICYINKIQNKHFILTIAELDNEIMKTLNLNKPIYYVFENITFNLVNIDNNSNINLIFRNCTFNDNIYIVCRDKVIFENNNFLNNGYYQVYYDIRASKLFFINNKNYYDGKINADINFETDFLEIKNAKIDTFDNLKIYSEKTMINNSQIIANKITLVLENAEYSNSFITAKESINIENEKYNFEGDMKTPYISYNGVIIRSEEDEVIKIDKEKIKLIQARQNLIEFLKKISNQCKEINDNELKEIQNNINKKSVGKVLKIIK